MRRRERRRPPPPPPVKRRVVIPSTLFLGEDAKLSTFRLGLLARYLAIFRVGGVLVFGEGPGKDFIVDVLRYVEIPQYLRRKLMPLKPTLRYAGVLPPLQAPHHPASPGGRGFTPEFREGVVLSVAGEWLLVNAGLGEPLRVKGRARVGDRVTLRLNGGAEVVDRRVVPYYWGYEVEAVSSLCEAVEECKGWLRVATSRKGAPLRRVAGRLVREARERGMIAVFFGERERGLFELAEEEGLNARECFDYIVNLAPQQGTYTLRTEEAVSIALALLGFLLD